MVPKHWWWWGAVGLLLAALLPVLGHWLRQDDRPRCALDGQTIDPLFRVALEFDAGRTESFCCLRCAELWIEASGEAPRSVTVTDEASGRSLAAEEATFVRSAVYSNAATGDRRHVFARREDATAHAEAFYGRILEGADRPLVGSP